ncbi:APC family permease [Sulfobacillus thermosulfidooxidans]|uniref:APC family permease n=1 Tax=Sulfobacillus thermosulfidooxidans TaxID=28034 RepID=UPI0002DC69C1|nr:APC family permease [Sulfobacillus thermosulfidooxidans]
MARRQVLPLRTAVSTSAGLASAAINFLACVEVAEYAGGPSAWIALLVAGALIVFSASNFAELSGLYPSAAAIRVWTRRGLNDSLSLVISLVYALTVIFVIAADAFVLANAFHAGIPQIPGWLWIVVLLLVIVIANLRGIRIAGRIQDANALLLLATLSIISMVILGKVPLPPVSKFLHVGPGIFQSIALGVFIYVGFEWVTPLAEEFSDARAIPRGMYIALGLIAIAFALFTVALTTIFPRTEQLKTTLIPQLLAGQKALGAVGFWWMLFVTMTTAMTTFNGGLFTASRFVYALAREKSLPKVFAHLNDRWVPSYALMTLAGLSLVLALVIFVTGQFTILINAGAGVEGLIYALSALLVIRLRRKEPTRARPFHALGVPWLTAMVGIVFLLLGVGALMTSSSPVPWPLVFVGTLVILTSLYVYKVVPQLKTKNPVKSMKRAREETIE